MQTETMPANEVSPAAPTQPFAEPDAAAAPVAQAPAAEKPKSNIAMLVFLFLAFLALTAMNIYQDHVIRQQRFEVRWMLEHGTFRIDPAEAAAGNVPKLPLKQTPQAQNPAASDSATPPSR